MHLNITECESIVDEDFFRHVESEECVQCAYEKYEVK